VCLSELEDRFMLDPPPTGGAVVLEVEPDLGFIMEPLDPVLRPPLLPPCRPLGGLEGALHWEQFQTSLGSPASSSEMTGLWHS